MSIVGFWSDKVGGDLKAVGARLQNDFPDLEQNKMARSFSNDGPRHLTSAMHIAFRDPLNAHEGWGGL